MKASSIFLALGILSLASCAETKPKTHPRTVAANDDRQFNIQSHNFETRDQATGLDATRRVER
jgi:hypothetical protein